MVLSAAQRSGAGATGEVEGTVYGGETSGAWICGPTGTMRYGGMGVSAKVAQREASPEEGKGATGSVSVGAEGQAIRAIDLPDDRLPPDSLMVGAQARAGYRWRWVGVEGGAGVYEGYDDSDSTNSSILLYPSVEVTVGPGDSAYGVIGVGSPGATTLLRPGAYLGGGYLSKSGFGLDLRTGLFRQGPAALDMIGYRLDLVGRGPIPGTEKMWLRIGGSVGAHEKSALPIDFEGSLGLVVGY
ncbi:MAG TPA: hypothetical protein VE093_34325 [Polyangiaceae bacterium]|nr:hypothetical protein [Polyangiaceae bacterium]